MLVSHVDVYERLPPSRWCEAFSNTSKLEVGAAQDLVLQTVLTTLVTHAAPQYQGESITCADDLLARFQAAAALPVRYLNPGNTHLSMRQRLSRQELQHTTPHALPSDSVNYGGEECRPATA